MALAASKREETRRKKKEEEKHSLPMDRAVDTVRNRCSRASTVSQQGKQQEKGEEKNTKERKICSRKKRGRMKGWNEYRD